MTQKKPEQPAPFFRLVSEAIGPALRILSRPQALAQAPRLFTEGLAPVRRLMIQAHNKREMLRLASEGVQLQFVSSFARSGNTWVRYLLADVLLQNRGEQTTTELSVPPEEIIPDYYCDYIARRDQSVRMPGVLIKTHDVFETVWQGMGAAPLTEAPSAGPPPNCKILYIFRRPEDVLVSFYHLHLRQKYVRSTVFGIDAFCRSAMDGWMQNVASYLRAADLGAPIYFASYETLLHEPAATLTGILAWLGIEHNAERVKRAVDHMEFSNLRKVEERRPPHQTKEFFFRRGRKGSGLMELQPQTLAEIRDHTSSLVKQADKRMARQKSGRHDTAEFKQRPAPGNGHPRQSGSSAHLQLL